MDSLRSLLRAHAPLLLIDSCSQTIHVGLAGEAEAPVRWRACAEEAASGIFRATELLLGEAGLRIADIRGFAFCEGPGSVLGIRIAAAALRAWQVITPAPVYAFQGLAVLAQTMGNPEARIIADARRDHWHVAQLGRPIARVPTQELVPPLFMPEGFRHWTPLPEGVAQVPYALPSLLAATIDVPLFRKTDQPDAFLHETPAYAKWSPRVHQAPSPSL